MFSFPNTEKQIQEEELKFGNSELHKCVRLGDTIGVMRELDNGADINREHIIPNETPLMSAIKYKKIEVLKVLLGRPEIDINKGNARGETALMLAADKKWLPGVKELLAHQDINVNKQSKIGDYSWGNTALIEAIQYGFRTHDSNSKMIIHLLLNHPQIDVSISNGYNYTAVDYCNQKRPVLDLDKIKSGDFS